MAAPVHQLLVNGVDRTSDLQPGWSVTQTFGQHGAMATFRLEAKKSAIGSLPYTVQALQTVQLKDTGLGINLFTGVVMQPGLKPGNYTKADWRLHCRDYGYFLDKAIVAKDYVANTASDATIKDMVAAVPGNPFNVANVQVGPAIPRVVANYIPVTSGLDLVTKIASNGAIFGWYLDGLNLYWFNQSQAPVNAAYLSDDESDSSASAIRFKFSDYYDWDAKDLRNASYTRGGNLATAQKTDNFVGNGSQTSWPLTYGINNAKPGVVVTVGGVNKTVAIDNGLLTPVTDYVVTKAVPGMNASRGQWYLQTGMASAPANGVAIVCTYNYLNPVVSRVDDLDSQTQFAALPNKGIFVSVINDTNIVDSTTAVTRGLRELQEYAWPQEHAKVETVEAQKIPAAYHFKAGDVVKMVAGQIPDSQNSFTPGLTKATAGFLVVGCTFGSPRGIYRRYSLDLVRVS